MTEYETISKTNICSILREMPEGQSYAFGLGDKPFKMVANIRSTIQYLYRRHIRAPHKEPFMLFESEIQDEKLRVWKNKIK
jgi:hypothetical protein